MKEKSVYKVKVKKDLKKLLTKGYAGWYTNEADSREWVKRSKIGGSTWKRFLKKIKKSRKRVLTKRKRSDIIENVAEGGGKLKSRGGQEMDLEN